MRAGTGRWETADRSRVLAEASMTLSRAVGGGAEGPMEEMEPVEAERPRTWGRRSSSTGFCKEKRH